MDEVGLQDDYMEAVEVQETEDRLSDQQRATLREKMTEINPTDTLSEEILISQYTAAREFINFCLHDIDSN